MGADVAIECRIEVYLNQGDWWLTITDETRELFGPYETDDEAIAAIPDALRRTFG